jgi:hypothetical protein
MPTPKLYLVTYAFDVIVLAETEADARVIADSAADEEFRSNFFAQESLENFDEIRKIGDVPEAWRDDIPYAGEGLKNEDKSVVVWLERILEAERLKRLAGPAPGQMELALGGGDGDGGEQAVERAKEQESTA